MIADGDVHIDLVSWLSRLLSHADQNGTPSACAGCTPARTRLRHCQGATTSPAQQPISPTTNNPNRYHLACGWSMLSTKSRDGDACLHRCSREAGVWPCTTTVDDLKHGEHATVQGSRLVPSTLPLALKTVVLYTTVCANHLPAVAAPCLHCRCTHTDEDAEHWNLAYRKLCPLCSKYAIRRTSLPATPII